MNVYHGCHKEVMWPCMRLYHAISTSQNLQNIVPLNRPRKPEHHLLFVPEFKAMISLGPGAAFWCVLDGAGDDSCRLRCAPPVWTCWQGLALGLPKKIRKGQTRNGKCSLMRECVESVVSQTSWCQHPKVRGLATSGNQRRLSQVLLSAEVHHKARRRHPFPPAYHLLDSNSTHTPWLIPLSDRSDQFRKVNWRVRNLGVRWPTFWGVCMFCSPKPNSITVCSIHSRSAIRILIITSDG